MLLRPQWFVRHEPGVGNDVVTMCTLHYKHMCLVALLLIAPVHVYTGVSRRMPDQLYVS